MANSPCPHSMCSLGKWDCETGPMFGVTTLKTTLRIALQKCSTFRHNMSMFQSF